MGSHHHGCLLLAINELDKLSDQIHRWSFVFPASVDRLYLSGAIGLDVPFSGGCRVRINDEQARAAYAIAVRVYAGELTTQAGTDELKRVHRLNSSSARDFINDFKCMMSGRVFQRTMNAYATDYFLTHIRPDIM